MFFSTRGTPINVRALAETLGKSGYSVDLLVYPFGENLNINNVNIIRSKKVPFVKSVPVGPSLQKILLDIPYFFHVFCLIIRNNYKVIHGIEEAGLVIGLVRKLLKAKVVFDMDSHMTCLLYTSPSPRDATLSRMPSSA